MDELRPGDGWSIQKGQDEKGTEGFGTDDFKLWRDGYFLF